MPPGGTAGIRGKGDEENEEPKVKEAEDKGDKWTCAICGKDFADCKCYDAGNGSGGFVWSV